MSSSEDETAKAFGISEDLVQSREHNIPRSTNLDFGGLLETPLRLHEDQSDGCGGMLWPAGMVLSKYLLRQDPDLLKGKSIVELGAGGGLVGLAIESKFHLDQPLIITDQKVMFPLMERNISLNGLEGRVKPLIYDWGGPVPDGIPKNPDIVLAGECVYFEPAFPLLQQTLKDLIGPKTICYLCFKKRRRADMKFVKIAKKMFHVESVEDDPEKPIWSRENLFLFKITRKENPK